MLDQSDKNSPSIEEIYHYTTIDFNHQTWWLILPSHLLVRPGPIGFLHVKGYYLQGQLQPVKAAELSSQTPLGQYLLALINQNRTLD